LLLMSPRGWKKVSPKLHWPLARIPLASWPKMTSASPLMASMQRRTYHPLASVLRTIQQSLRRIRSFSRQARPSRWTSPSNNCQRFRSSWSFKG
jgi:hypothetical protein